MHTRSHFTTTLVCATVLTASIVLSNAGPLTPPAGPVASTNKPLQEVEPRIAVNATNTPGDADSLFRITSPGSYYLTENLVGAAFKDGIRIEASGVTLDLMGFEVLGVAASIDGISVTASASNVHIRNGSVRNWGDEGVNATLAVGSMLSALLSADNGSQGLSIGAGSTVTGCTARGNGSRGIFAGAGSTISGNSSHANGLTGIFADDGSTVSGNTAAENSGAGIFAGDGSTVSNNTSSNNSQHGIATDGGLTIIGNTARLNTLNGILVFENCLVLNNTCNLNGNGGDGAGIHVTGSNSRIEGNTVTSNDRGIDVDGTGNLIIRNSWSGNTQNAPIVAGNSVGPTVNSASIATSSNPHANYSF